MSRGLRQLVKILLPNLKVGCRNPGAAIHDIPDVLVDCGSWISAAAKGIEVPQYKPFYTVPLIYLMVNEMSEKVRISYKS